MVWREFSLETRHSANDVGIHCGEISMLTQREKLLPENPPKGEFCGHSHMGALILASQSEFYNIWADSANFS